VNVYTDTALQRRLRWRRWLARAADLVFAGALFATLALALAPLAVNLLRSDVRGAIHAEEVWIADRSVGTATAMLTGRMPAAVDDSPAVDRAGQALAGLR
jgi:hypothetical protein